MNKDKINIKDLSPHLKELVDKELDNRNIDENINIDFIDVSCPIESEPINIVISKDFGLSIDI